MSAQELLDQLIQDPTRKISIQGKVRSIVGFAEFKTINLGEESYYKIIFDDHSFLFIVPSQDLLLFTSDAPAHFAEIPDEDIGIKQNIASRGKDYILENAHDYQYVVRLIVGDWKSIEGEVKFSDYVPADGASELLSLGWITRTGERADVNPKHIDITDISILI